MSRKGRIAVTGIALLACRTLIKNATRSVEIVPATVISIDRVSPEQGADMWRILFELSDRNEYVIRGLAGRPPFVRGDRFCVQKHQRAWAWPTFWMVDKQVC